MKTLATALVTMQEISENLKAGMALENIHGEFFYLNENWPEITGPLNANPEAVRIRTEEGIYLGDLLKRTQGMSIAGDNGADEEIEPKSPFHLVLRFSINYASGEPFCYCSLAKKIENKEQLFSVIEKVNEIFKAESHSVLKFFNHATYYYEAIPTGAEVK